MVELARRSVLLNLLATPLAPRLAPSARLTLPTASGEVGMAGCVSYPDWLLGTWDVSNTLQRFVMPLGSALVDPLTQLSAMDDLRRDETLRYLLRWTRDGTGACVQDRAFNGAQEAAAFLGDLGSVAASVFATPPDAPHGRLRIDFEPDGGEPHRQPRDVAEV
jgi:hypothetical protein